MNHKNDFAENHAEEEIECSEFQDVSRCFIMFLILERITLADCHCSTFKMLHDYYVTQSMLPGYQFYNKHLCYFFTGKPLYKETQST